MNQVTNIVISGVGGQGTILASRIFGQIAMDNGLDIKVSEVHGMSQRGGSVITYVRYGKEIFSPIVEEGEADYLLAFESLEAIRWLHLLKKGGTVIMSTQQIMPSVVLSGVAEYPKDIAEKLEQFKDISIIGIDALKIAKDLNFIRAANVALIGAFAAVSDLPYESFTKSLEIILNGRNIRENMSAFEEGYNSVRRI